MAKKISGAKTSAAASERGVHAVSASGLQEPSKRAEARAPKPAKPSALLDTRVIYCGDNLEQAGRMRKEEGRMMKPAWLPILHSSFCLLNSSVTGSFYYHCDWHASHYVKVMIN